MNQRILILIAVATLLVLSCPAHGEGQSAETGGVVVTDYRAVGISFAAALTMALCVFAAAWAVGRIGSAAMGAAAEKPELLMRSLLFVALAEGLAVLGFVIAIMMLRMI